MADLREQLRAIETAPPPDLWTGIEARAREERAAMDTNATVMAFRKPGSEWRGRVLAGLVAAAVVALVAVAVIRAMRPTPVKVPTGVNPTAGWQQCTNDFVGYSMSYPAGWHTTDVFEGTPNPDNACMWFQPEAFGPEGNTVPEGWAFPLEVVARTQPLEVILADTIDPEFARVITQQELVVDGHRAVRIEYETLFDPFADTGLHYQYLIAVDAEGSTRLTLVVHTTETRGIEGDYDDNKEIVDLAVGTLRFAA